MKKRSVCFFIALLLVLGNVKFIQAKEEYNATVMLYKKYEDSISMGNNALYSKAKVINENGKYKMIIKFIPLETMGYVGYLGYLEVNGKKAKVLSEYDIVDEFNDSKTGKDPIIKGKFYPKELEFEINPNIEFIDAKVYVPIMATLGFGEQDVRIKFNIENFARTQNSERKDNILQEKKLNKINLEDGIYETDIKLMHELENKLSMGNAAINKKAEILVKDSKPSLFIGVDKIEIQNITAALESMYYLNDKKYLIAEAADYDLEVPNNPQKRPRVFKINMEDVVEEIQVMVDPKVEPMGDEPLKARLFIDLNSIKKIDEDQADLLHKFKDGVKKVEFKSDDKGEKVDKNFCLNFDPNTFEKDFNFYANKLTGEKLEEFNSLFNSLAIKEIYSFETLRLLSEIDKDVTNTKEIREKINPKKEVTIKIPIKNTKIKPENEPKIYKIDNGIKTLVNYKVEDDKYVFKTGSLGTFAIVKENNEASSLKTRIGDKKNLKLALVKKKNMPNKKIANKKNSPILAKNNISAFNTEVRDNKKSPENSDVNLQKYNEIDLKANHQENMGLIVFISILIIFVNLISIVILRKNYSAILEAVLENKRLKERISKNEK